MGKRRRKRISCPNCSIHLKEEMNYCFNCGQENHVKRVSVKMLTNDFASTYFSFDSKLLRSLKYLITKPSFLSTEYLDGKIEAYLRPIRLYVFISFIFFILLGISSSNVFLNDSNNIDQSSNIIVETNDNNSVENLEKDELDIPFFSEDFIKKFREVFSDKKEKNKFFNYLREKSPIIIFATIPLLAGYLFLFFYKKQYYYIDHFVFALHLQTFLFVLLSITTIIDIIFNEDTGGFAFLGLLIYGVISAKKFYKRNMISTIIRLMLIGVVHMFSVSIILTVYALFMLNIYTT